MIGFFKEILLEFIFFNLNNPNLYGFLKFFLRKLKEYILYYVDKNNYKVIIIF